ncbi:MAG: low molecular weight protein-tyrosine-phosphatase [Crinalium sp.]
MPYKLLFVCLGNICRSPAAENIMNYLIKQATISDAYASNSASIVCDSAGTAGYHIGSSPDRRMVAALGAKEIPSTGKARQFQKSDLENFDMILAMDRQNYQDILALDPANRYQDKVRLMCEFCQHHDQQEVPDPYYGGTEGFNQVIELLLDACGGLLEHLAKEDHLNNGE